MYVPLHLMYLSSLCFSSMLLHIDLCVALLAICDEPLLIWAQVLLAAYSAFHLLAYLPPQICCPIYLAGLTEGWCCPSCKGPAALMAAWNSTRSPDRGQSMSVQKVELPLAHAVVVIDSTTKWMWLLGCDLVRTEQYWLMLLHCYIFYQLTF